MSNNRHILFVASWYPNRNQPVLGNFVARHALAASISNRISVVALFSDTKDPGLHEQHAQNLSEYVMYFSKVNSTTPIISTIRKVKTYRNAMREAIQAAIKRNGKPDIIHVHVAWPVALEIVSIAQELNIPIVLTEHWSGYLPEDGNYRGYFLKRYTKQLFAAAKIITVVSEKMKTAMLGHGLDGKFHQLPNAVDTSVFHFHPLDVRKRDSTFRFLHVSMLVDREKNITGLLKGFALACKQSPMLLTIIGDGPERIQHENTARELGISASVEFAGLKNAVDIAEYMNNSDALVMFSHFEGMPVTIIEAQCCGLPVIATSTGAIPEMLNAEVDILVQPGNVQELKRALLAAKLNNSSTEFKLQIRSAISVKARAKYSLEAVGKDLDAIYEEVLQQR